MRRYAFLVWQPIFFGMLLRAQLTVPQLGIAHFSDGSVRVIRGVPANLLVGSKAMASADFISFSDVGGLTSSNGLIRLLRTDGTVMGEYQSAETKPILNIDSSLRSAVAWLPSQHSILRWDGAKFFATPVNDSSFEGTVSFVELSSDAAAQFFVVLPDLAVARVSVALPSGQLISSEIQPGIDGKVFVQHGWLLSQSERGLEAELPTGARQRIALGQGTFRAGDLSIERMSGDWLHVFSQSAGTNWAVYFSSSNVNISLLPPPVQGAAQ